MKFETKGCPIKKPFYFTNMEECVLKTLREMLQQRGYEVFYDEEENMAGRKGRTSTIVVFFNLAPKVNNDRIQEYITKMRHLNYTHAIVVYQLSVTPPAEKVLQELQGLRIEMFQSIPYFQRAKSKVLKMSLEQKFLFYPTLTPWLVFMIFRKAILSKLRDQMALFVIVLSNKNLFHILKINFLY